MVEQDRTATGESPEAAPGAEAIDRPDLLDELVKEAISRPEIVSAARSAQLSPERLQAAADAAKQSVWTGAANLLAPVKEIDAAIEADALAARGLEAARNREWRWASAGLAVVVGLGVVDALAALGAFRGAGLPVSLTTPLLLLELVLVGVAVLPIGRSLLRWAAYPTRAMWVRRRAPRLGSWLAGWWFPTAPVLRLGGVNIPRSRQDLDRQREVAMAQLTEAVVDRGLISHLRSAINQGAGASYATEIHVEDAPGLSEVYDNSFGIPTEAGDRVRKLMRRMRGASIGVSGVRGAGKTTLIRSFCDPTFVGAAEVDGDTDERTPLRVMVSAPVEYEPREFILHLFGKLCQAVIGPDADELPAGFSAGAWDLSQRLAASWPLARVAVMGTAGIFAIGGASLIILSASGVKIDSQLISLAIAGALTLLGLNNLAYAFLARVWSRPAWADEPRPHFRHPNPIGVGIAFGSGFLFIAIGTAIALTAGLHVGQWTGAALGVWVLAIAAAVLLAVIAVPSRPPSSRTIELQLRLSGRAGLLELARTRLQSIRFQQSFSSSWGAGLHALGGLKMPIDLEAQFGRSTTLAPVETSFPDVVDLFQSFVRQTQPDHRVLIGIDELDKIASRNKAREFLNDIKGVFGVPGCYFLISVSEDALASFERRGMPFRDVFDSAFDEIVSVPYLNLMQSLELLSQRVIGMPRPFMSLCYCLSGGLPRDLIRAARSVVSLPANTVKLGDVTKALMLAELPGKTDAVVRATTEVEVEPLTSEAVEWSLKLDVMNITAAQLLSHCSELESYAGLRTSAQAGPDPKSPEAHVIRHARELSSLYYYSATVLEFFGDSLDQAKLHRAEAPAKAKESLDYLAGARRAFAVNSRLAWERVSAFRAAWQLATIGFPFIAPTAGAVAAVPVPKRRRS